MLRSKTLEKYSLHKSIDSTAATQDQLSVQPGDEGVAVTRLALIGNADIGGRLVEVKSADSRNSGSRRGCPNHSQKEINILFTL